MIGQRGFTLLELLVSLAIAAILVMTQVAPFQRTLVSRDRAEVAMERTSEARLTLQRLAEEVSGAVPLAGPDASFQVVDRTLDLPASELRFATSNAQRVESGPRDPVQIVRYSLEPAPLGSAAARGPRTMRLVKEQRPSVAAPEVEPARFVVLEDVLRFKVRVVPPGGDAWTETWGDVEADGRSAGRVPRAVELELVVADGTPAPPVYRLAVELPLGGSA